MKDERKRQSKKTRTHTRVITFLLPPACDRYDTDTCGVRVLPSSPRSTRRECPDVRREVEQRPRHRLHHGQTREELFLRDPRIRARDVGVTRAHTGGRRVVHQRTVLQRAHRVVLHHVFQEQGEDDLSAAEDDGTGAIERLEPVKLSRVGVIRDVGHDGDDDPSVGREEAARPADENEQGTR